MYTLGADPELFIIDTTTGNCVSSHNLIEGTKENPFKVMWGATQVDGVSAEFNIDPCENSTQFVNKIYTVTDALQKMINAKSGSTCLKLEARPVVYFDEEYFNSLPEETRLLGCTPDFNAYTAKENEPPITNECFRTGSGHIHVGGFTSSIGDYGQDIRNRVKQLDYTIYPISLLWDKDQKRRELYGKPGAFRYKPYGFEYRVLSNRWVKDYRLQTWVFDATKRAMELYDQGEHLYDEVPPEDSYEQEYIESYLDMLVREYNFPDLKVR